MSFGGPLGSKKLVISSYVVDSLMKFSTTALSSILKLSTSLSTSQWWRSSKTPFSMAASYCLFFRHPLSLSRCVTRCIFPPPPPRAPFPLNSEAVSATAAGICSIVISFLLSTNAISQDEVRGSVVVSANHPPVPHHPSAPPPQALRCYDPRRPPTPTKPRSSALLG